jgi:L,D-transpeptidase catalytic domain
MARGLRELRRFARRHRFALALLACVALAGAAAWALLRDAEQSGRDRPPRGAAVGVSALVEFLSFAIPFEPLSEPPEARISGRRFPLARVRDGESIELRQEPDGEALASLGDTTEFGSPTTLWVAEARGDWIGVPAPELGNGKLGWVRDDHTRLEISLTRFWLVVHRARRLLELRYGDRVLDRYPVTVGRPGTETPLGSFSVTDALAGPTLGPYYGCCALALSGHQSNLPEGWFGGDRMAIHGTPGALGLAASAGCIRASDQTMVSLFARVPLGTPVFVRP